MSTLNKFVGINAKSQSTKWLNEFFHGNEAKGKALFYGASGNRKTLLARLLSESYETELLSICPFDIKGEDILNDFIKSVNSKSLFSKGKIKRKPPWGAVTKHDTFLKDILLVTCI